MITNVNRKIVPFKGANYRVKKKCEFCGEKHTIKNAIKMVYLNGVWIAKPQIEGCDRFKNNFKSLLKNERN